MGIQERKKRQLAEREQHFLDQAWALIQRDGVLNLQMSKLASECEYAVGTLYLHFSSKEDLLLGLAIRNVENRLALYQQAVKWQAPSRHRILAIVVANVLFAKQAPEFCRLSQYVSTNTIWMAASEERRAAALKACEPLGAAVQEVVEDALKIGDVDSHGLSGREICTGLWAMTEGMHSLVGAAGLLEANSVPKPYQLLMRHAHALLNGLDWQPLISLDDLEFQHNLLEQIMREVFPNIPMSECIDAST